MWWRFTTEVSKGGEREKMRLEEKNCRLCYEVGEKEEEKCLIGLFGGMREYDEVCGVSVFEKMREKVGLQGSRSRL